MSMFVRADSSFSHVLKTGRTPRKDLLSWQTLQLLLLTLFSAAILLSFWGPMFVRSSTQQLLDRVSRRELNEWQISLIYWSALLLPLSSIIYAVTVLSGRGALAVIRASTALVGAIGLFHEWDATTNMMVWSAVWIVVEGHGRPPTGFDFLLNNLEWLEPVFVVPAAIMAILAPGFAGLIMVLLGVGGVAYVSTFYGGLGLVVIPGLAYLGPLVLSAALIGLFGSSPPRHAVVNGTSFLWTVVDLGWLLGAAVWLNLAYSWYLPQNSPLITMQVPMASVAAATTAPFAIWATLFARLCSASMSPGMALMTGKFGLLADVLWRECDARLRGGLVATAVAVTASGAFIAYTALL